MNSLLRGESLLSAKSLNKGTAFNEAEREELGLRGLLPAAVCDQKIHATRVLNNLRRKAFDIERYIFLQSLSARNERLYYRVLIDNIEELMPIIYTPTVGQACSEFDQIFRQTQGFYITVNDKTHIRTMLDNWPEKDIQMIVITDGQRILGLGDLGANGMGIPIGKLALYCACAGIHPSQCLPVMLDVGTTNETLRNNPMYLGTNQARLEGDEYLELVDEFVEAVQDAYPTALIQFEDFLTPNAYQLLNIYRNKILCFNDDIQGTAAVALAGIYAATKVSGTEFKDLRILFLGAGSAAAGIGDLICKALIEIGLDESEAQKRLWFVDQRGLVVSRRENLAPHIIPYAHECDELSFDDAINLIKPHVLIGATGAPNTFTQSIIESMSNCNERPVIFALSNPTSRAECTAEQAYGWSHGKAIFASGSPFAEVEYEGKKLKPGQGNNAYVFPGIGLGAIACNARIISDEMFLTAALSLACQVAEEDYETGSIYPPLRNIRDVSLKIAVAVAEKAYEQGLAQKAKPENLTKFIESLMYDPTY
jgi:malate dehydrogenase (oxaloacetate-decarboxylating)(NADP+)